METRDRLTFFFFFFVLCESSTFVHGTEQGGLETRELLNCFFQFFYLNANLKKNLEFLEIRAFKYFFNSFFFFLCESKMFVNGTEGVGYEAERQFSVSLQHPQQLAGRDAVCFVLQFYWLLLKWR